MKLVWTFILVCVWATTVAADNRLWVLARVNGKPAYLIFDTGAERTALFKTSADRFGLKSTWPHTDGQSVSNAPTIGVTDEGVFELGRASLRTWFQVMAPPAYFADVKGDGVLGWSAFDADLLQIDADNSVVKPLAKLPRNLGTWQHLSLAKGTRILAFEVPDSDGKPSDIYLDTGAHFGANLNSVAWRGWRAIHTNQPVNVEWYYSGNAGFVITEEAWAEQLTLGPINLTSVPVSEANAAEIAQFTSGYKATLGIAALRRLDLVIDRRHGCAYVRPKTTPPRPYDHNRTGVAIEPKNSGQVVIARVVKDGPGDEAGIRTGDVLLKIGRQDVSDWHSAPFSETAHSPAGSRLEVTLERGGTNFATTLVLRDLLGQNPDSLKSPRSKRSAPPQRTNDFSYSKVAIRLRPPDAEDYNRRGFVYESNGRLDEAMTNYYQATQLDPSSDEPYVFLGYVYCLQSNWDKAISACNEAIRLKPSKAENHWRRATAYQGKGDLKKAIEDYSYALRLDPKATNAYCGRGWCYCSSGDIDLAIDDFSKALALNAPSAEIYRFRGYAYAQHGELYLAVSDLSEAIRLQPTNAWAYGMRGEANARRREWEKAIQDYAEAIKLDPKNPTTYRNLAWLQATCPEPSLRNGTAALEESKKACELTNWKDAGALEALAAASAEIGDFENAIKYEQQGLALDGLSEQERKAEVGRLSLYQVHKAYHQPGRE